MIQSRKWPHGSVAHAKQPAPYLMLRSQARHDCLRTCNLQKIRCWNITVPWDELVLGGRKLQIYEIGFINHHTGLLLSLPYWLVVVVIIHHQCLKELLKIAAMVARTIRNLPVIRYLRVITRSSNGHEKNSRKWNEAYAAMIPRIAVSPSPSKWRAFSIKIKPYICKPHRSQFSCLIGGTKDQSRVHGGSRCCLSYPQRASECICNE